MDLAGLLVSRLSLLMIELLLALRTHSFAFLVGLTFGVNWRESRSRFRGDSLDVSGLCILSLFMKGVIEERLPLRGVTTLTAFSIVPLFRDFSLLHFPTLADALAELIFVIMFWYLDKIEDALSSKGDGDGVGGISWSSSVEVLLLLYEDKVFDNGVLNIGDRPRMVERMGDGVEGTS